MPMDPGTSRGRNLGVLGVESAVRAPAVKEVMIQLAAFGISPTELIWETLSADPVSSWPRCDVLLLFPSAVVDLEKVKEYVEMTRCSELNTISGCEILRDRAAMYRRCEKFGIPIPPWLDSMDPEAVVEEADRITVKGRTLDKPFVEKPLDSEDHSVYIYFPQSAGGGRMRIDRKNKIFETVSTVRRDGKYVYQKFIASEGFETKLYAIGGEYVHAEAVPSRMADASQGGRGAEPSQPVPIYLRPREKIIPLRVGLAFGLTVFKAHILRTPTPLSGTTNGKQQSRSSILFDISVGRSSFAKQDKDYFIDSASALATEILKRAKPNTAEGSRCPPLAAPSVSKRVAMTVDFRHSQSKLKEAMFDIQSIKEALRTLKPSASPSSSQAAALNELAPVLESSNEWTLRCVVALVRHGDRTCKQKLTVKFEGDPPEDVTQLRPEEGGEDFRQNADLERISAILNKHKDRRKSDLSVLQQALEILHQRVTNSGALDNLKAKLEIASASTAKSGWTVKLKWGGDLTPLGMGQAETAGRFFRKTIYDKKDNILHMHASLHHDLKVYASEDRRCQQTAASFAKGLLELSMQLPVIQTGFVRSDGLGRLDDQPFRHSEQVERTREDLAALLFGADRGAALARRLALSGGAADVLAAIEKEHGGFGEAYERLDAEVGELTRLLGSLEEGARLYGKETVVLLRNRWYELKKHLDNLRKSPPCPGKLSVVGDIFDNAVYDSRHNLAFLADHDAKVGERLKYVRTLVRKLYSIVTPCEYGLEAEHKAVIGATFIHPLVRKFRWDMRVASGADLGDEEEHLVRYAELYKAIGIENQVRTRLYFAHHSHMLSFLNVLRFGFIRGELDMVAENGDWLNNKVTHLGYLSQIIMQLYECQGQWQLRILLMPGDDFNSPHGSIAFANNQKLIFTCEGDLDKIDNLFTSMLNIVALPLTPTSNGSPNNRPLSPEDPRFL